MKESTYKESVKTSQKSYTIDTVYHNTQRIILTYRKRSVWISIVISQRSANWYRVSIISYIWWKSTKRISNDYQYTVFKFLSSIFFWSRASIHSYRSIIYVTITTQGQYCRSLSTNSWHCNYSQELTWRYNWLFWYIRSDW